MEVPTGWFECASDDVRDTVTAARVGNVDLVVWRDAKGVAHVQAAHCPHLGAHLGYGGSVHGAAIQCPFHGWRFGADGRCVGTGPARTSAPPVTLPTYAAAERAGAVFAWMGDGVPFALPEFDWFTRTDVMAPEPLQFGRVRAVVGDFVENAADTVHFETVHDVADAPVLESYDFHGPIARVRTRQQYATPRGAVAGRIDIDVVGPGITYTEYSGLFDGAALATFTPVGEHEVVFTVRFRFAAATPEHLVASFVAGSRRQIERDLVLWAHRIHHDEPAVLPADGPILEVRAWLAQFG